MRGMLLLTAVVFMTMLVVCVVGPSKEERIKAVVNAIQNNQSLDCWGDGPIHVSKLRYARGIGDNFRVVDGGRTMWAAGCKAVKIQEGGNE
ncbi:hypothetical protein [Oceanidesulfovibrio marinus]|uniref:hypothetical protein n=1 Tax=Oceanidesulfovibrio marinus TaxID=370038 RepID=UPI0011871C88|nr:hypothetical protein [Oceanidesulfovibrio marinus]